jgi:hypothetical protein
MFELDLLFLGLVLFSAFNANPVFRGHIMASWSVPQIVEYRTLYQQADMKDEATQLPSFLHLLNEFRPSDATNPLDHVYALLGLLEVEERAALEREELVPDYTEGNSISKCYVKTAKAIYTTTNRLDILGLAHPRFQFPSKSANSGLPSWAPDWNSKVKETLSPKHGIRSLGGKEKSLFLASGACHTWTAQFRGDATLVVSGYIVDTVLSVSDRVLPGMSDSFLDMMQMDDLEKFLESQEQPKLIDMVIDILARMGSVLNTLFEWENFVSSRAGPYPSGEDIGHVSCAVRCYGNVPEGIDAAFQDFKEYQRSLSWTRRIYNLAVSPSRPSLPFRRNSQAAKSQPSKLRQALVMVGAPSRSDKARMVKFNSLQSLSVGRKLAWTEKGYLALVHEDTKTGDAIALAKGSGLPLTMRATEGANQWKVLEGCYVHGIMHGEAWDESLCSEINVI